ncbi:unnamed protein product [Wuchereria bancrofti]|uniref:Uncharacterized protein n=1 Tax=Wuchereria bancrofti TaxID=6293 RepID=A0A3P7FX31_WUCBA|nr:unnamed protein product [Wuchereria bancrofti]
MIVLNYRFIMTKIDICIFLFALIATFAYVSIFVYHANACGPLPNGVLKPDSGPDVVVVTDAPHVVTDATDATDEVESTTAGEAERKKRDIGAKGKVEKCKGAEVVITTDEAESSDGAFETVKKLESEVVIY